MKHHHGFTNIGVIGGFATLDADGTLVVRQTSCEEAAYRLRPAPEVRAPAYDNEPVVVLVRAVASAEGAPTLEALHLARATAAHMPRSPVWNKKRLPRNVDFYPMTPTFQVKPEIIDALAADLDLPAWAVEAAAEDDLFAEILEHTSSGKHWQSRMLLTGFITCGDYVPTDDPAVRHVGYTRLYLTQSRDTPAIPVRLYEGTQGYTQIVALAESKPQYPVTLMLKPFLEVEVDGDGKAARATLDMWTLEMTAACPADIDHSAVQNLPDWIGEIESPETA